MKIVYIPLIQIRMEEKPPRRFVHEGKIQELADSFNSVGVLQPIIVQREEEEEYRLVAGQRRLRAAHVSGLQEIPAIIYDRDICRRQIQLVENLQREELNPLDRAEAIKDFMDGEKLSKTAAGVRLGIPRTTLSEWLDILEIDKRYQQAIVENYYGGSSTLTCSHLSLARRFADKVGDPSLLDTALDVILYYKLTRSDAKKVFDLVVGNPNRTLEQAVLLIRRRPYQRGEQRTEEWDLDRMLESLSRSGDYLVKCDLSDLNNLSSDDRRELVRRSRALGNLLRELIESVEESPASVKKAK